MSVKPLDWAVMFDDLGEHYTNKEIAKKIGVTEVTVSKVRREVLQVESWDIAIRILDLYIKMVGIDIPRLGDYNKYIKEDVA